MKTNLTLHPARGFTMVELLVTISIIMVLMGLTMGALIMLKGRSTVAKAGAEIALFSNRLEAYKDDTGEFPPGDGTDRSTGKLYQRLYEDGNLDTTKKIYMGELDPDGKMFKGRIKNGIIRDPFNKKKNYFYLRGVDENGRQNDQALNPDFDIWSLGPNGIGRGDGGNSKEAREDDITNWK